METKIIPKIVREAYENAPTARHLNEQEQKDYEEACKSYGKKAQESLNIPMKGSNLFKVLLLNQTGIRTATLDEIASLAESNPEFLKGFFEDSSSVALRSAGDSCANNDYLAKQLASLIRKRKISKPIVISGLKIKEDNNSAYGLSFEKADNFNFFEAPELANNNRKFSRFDERGMPIFDETGDKTLYTRDNGLSRVYLDRYLNLNSGNEYLADSIGNGRVVVVSAKGATKNFEAYTPAQIEKELKEIGFSEVSKELIDKLRTL